MLCYIVSITFFLHDLASFRAGIPTHRQLQRLTKNALVSLHDDIVTEEKVKVNILANPNTLFLAPANAVGERINAFVFNNLFGNENVMLNVINGLHTPMAIYKNMTVIIMENKYFLFSHYFFIKCFNVIPQNQILISCKKLVSMKFCSSTCC